MRSLASGSAAVKRYGDRWVGGPESCVLRRYLKPSGYVAAQTRIPVTRRRSESASWNTLIATVNGMGRSLGPPPQN